MEDEEIYRKLSLKELIKQRDLAFLHDDGIMMDAIDAEILKREIKQKRKQKS